MNTTVPGSVLSPRDQNPPFHNGPYLPPEVTKSILAYPYMSSVQGFCSQYGVNLYLFGSARDRVLFQEKQAMPLENASVDDLDLVVPLSGAKFSAFCTSLSLMVLTLGLPNIVVQKDTKNPLPQIHIMCDGRKIISLYGTFIKDKDLPEELQVMNRLATSVLNVEMTAICLPADRGANRGKAYVVSPYKKFKVGPPGQVSVIEKSPQIDPQTGSFYSLHGLSLGRFLNRFNRFEGLFPGWHLLMKRIYDQFTIMSGDEMSRLYRSTDHFYKTALRVTDYLSEHILLPRLVTIGNQEISFSNYVVPLVMIPAVLVQFPFLRNHYDALVGLPIYSSEKNVQVDCLDSVEKVQAMNRLLLFNSFVNSLYNRGFRVEGITEYVGIALGCAQLADRLMGLNPLEETDLTTYWFVEDSENPTFPKERRWKAKSVDPGFDSKFIVMGQGSYSMYSDLISLICESSINSNPNLITQSGIFNIKLLNKQVYKIIDQYCISRMHFTSGGEFASD